MSGLCAVTAAGLLLLTPADHFDLAWTHSVEKIEWREEWRVEAGRLHLVRASVQGSGAGMEPPPEAVLKDGSWTWNPDRSFAEVALARSDFTADWRLCVEGECRELPQKEKGQTLIRACP